MLVLGQGGTSVTGNTQARQDQLQAALTLYQQIYSNLLNNYEAVRLARLRSTPNIVQIQPASIPNKPIRPQPLRDIAMGSLFGAVLLGSVAFLIEYLDDTLKSPDDITRHLQLPVVGLIGEMEKPKRKDEKGLHVYVSDNPLSPITEAFRTLRTNLEFAGVDKPLKSLLITSTSPGEGKSTIAVNLAAVIAQGEHKVVLMDTDLRRPTLHRHLQIANRRGLSDLFRDSIKIGNVINTWGEPPIAVITSGGLPPNPSELLASAKMEAILRELESKSDVIILDAPPCIVADPVILAARVDGVLLVIEPGKTKIGAAQVVIEQLQRSGARIIGVVLNPISRHRSSYYTKYQYYSTYYSSNGYHHGGRNGTAKLKNNTKPIKSDEEYNSSTH
jgi:capsular exopolysaccharide synthesis family protein